MNQRKIIQSRESECIKQHTARKKKLKSVRNQPSKLMANCRGKRIGGGEPVVAATDDFFSQYSFY